MTWWMPWHRYSTWGAKRQGRVDGSQNIPAWENPDQPPYVLEVVEAAEHDIRKMVEEWHNRDRMLEARERQAREARDKADGEARQANEEFEKVCKQYTDDHGGPPPPGTDTRLFWYWLLLAFLFVFEFPFNAIVFRLFGESEVFTYLVTAAIAIALLGCAHLLGRFLKEGKWDRTGIALTVILIVVPILVIVAVAWLRQRYLSQVAEEEGGVWSQGTLFTFAAFNLLIFVVATVASYLVHNPLLFAVDRARKQRVKAQKRLSQAENAYARAEVDRRKIRDAYRTRARQIKDTAQRLILVYRTENLRHRTDKEQYQKQGCYQPESFRRENQPKIAEEALNQFEYEQH